MSGTNVIKPTLGTSSLEAPAFGPGMLLHHEDLEKLHFYTRDLSRLMFRSLFGCGVICGLVVKRGSKCGKAVITVGAGVALTCSGDPIEVPKDQTISLGDDCDSPISGPLWILLCATTKRCAPRTAICSPDDEESPPVHTRERAGFEIRVVNKRPDCVCGCDPENAVEESDAAADAKPGCYDDHEAGICGCQCGDCSGCSCECVLLAQLKEPDDENEPCVDHQVRRFIRPVLMPDPLVKKQDEAQEAAKKKAANEAAEKAKRAADEKGLKEVLDKALEDLAQRTREVAEEKGRREALERALEDAQKAPGGQAGTKSSKPARPGH